MKIASVVGARPQFVKLAPLAHAIDTAGHEHVIIHTGQHYDLDMSASFFADLGIPDPDFHLEVGSGSHGQQTGAILMRIEEALTSVQPDWVVAYGDTNSTIAGALAASKLGIGLAHLEAGLRSFNRRMPEELNRVATDHLSDLCLAPTDLAMENLRTEGLAARAHLVGDIMADVLFSVRERVGSSASPEDSFVLATIHRPSNTDTPARLESILSALQQLDRRVILAAHPRLRSKAAEFGMELEQGAVHVVAPLSYPDLVRHLQAAEAVVTDSGGLQKEAFLMRVPCTTVREETEWVETVSLGWNVVCPDPDQLRAAITRERPAPTSATPYGDGHTADRVLDILAKG